MNVNKLYNCTKVLQFSPYRLLSTSIVRPLIQKWREDRGLPLNPNAYGILTDRADYTYLNGKPTPCGVRQHKRIENQRKIAQKVIVLTKEVDFAMERHARLLREAEQHKQDILNNKLKSKGNLLLK